MRAVLVWVCSSAQPLVAQTVSGTVRGADSGQPVAITLVMAESEGGDEVRTLSHPDGSFHLSLTAPGRWRIVARHIGFTTFTSDWRSLDVGQALRLDPSMETAALPIEGLDVTVDSRCRGLDAPKGGARPGLVFDLWDQARAALEVALQGQAERRLTFTSRSYRRSFELPSERSLGERTSARRGVASHPFRSLPAESLSDSGYVRTADDGATVWYGPDLEVLLSDAFLGDHCFRPVDDGDRLGLSFEPTEGRSTADVRGTLWFRPGSAILALVEFTYTGVAGLASDGPGGGVIEFDQLPEGWWYVDSWELRMPRFGVDVREGRRVVMGLVVVGGEAEDVAAVPAELRLARRGPGTLAGRVTAFDGSPIQGVTVRAAPGGARARTGADGRFSLERLLPGSHALSVDHPLFHLGPGGDAAIPVSVAAGVVDSLEVVLPSAESVVDAFCGSRPPEVASIVGLVRSARDAAPLSGGTITAHAALERPQRVGAPEGVRLEEGFSSEITGDGAFVLCHVRPFLPVQIEVLGPTGQPFTFRVSPLRPGEVRIVDWGAPGA